MSFPSIMKGRMDYYPNAFANMVLMDASEVGLKAAMDRLERQVLQLLIDRVANTSVTEAAKLIGHERTTLIMKLKAYGLTAKFEEKKSLTSKRRSVAARKAYSRGIIPVSVKCAHSWEYVGVNGEQSRDGGEFCYGGRFCKYCNSEEGPGTVKLLKF